MGKKITILKDDKEVEYDVLFTITNEKKNIDYIVYTDNSIDSDGNINVYASKYSDNKKELILINTKKEKKLIEDVIKVIREEINNNSL